MKTALRLTKKQEDLLYLLRLDGLRREIELEEAKASYKKAAETEKAVQQYVIDYNEYFAALEYSDEMNGKRITDQRSDFMMSSESFNDYLIKINTAYKEIYGIDNPINFVYSEPFRERLQKAEREYMMIAVDFLKIAGSPEAQLLEKAVKSYIKDEHKKRLFELTDNFIRGK